MESEEPMQLEIEKGYYNQRRYGAPWIARVTWTPKGTYAFGNWVPGEDGGGTLVIQAQEGDVIATGQKDYRKGTREIEFHLVVGGALKPCTQAEAYDHYTKNNPLSRLKELSNHLREEGGWRGSEADLVAAVQQGFCSQSEAMNRDD